MVKHGVFTGMYVAPIWFWTFKLPYDDLVVCSCRQLYMMPKWFWTFRLPPPRPLLWYNKCSRNGTSQNIWQIQDAMETWKSRQRIRKRFNGKVIKSGYITLPMATDRNYDSISERGSFFVAIVLFFFRGNNRFPSGFTAVAPNKGIVRSRLTYPYLQRYPGNLTLARCWQNCGHAPEMLSLHSGSI